jgi:hypothetical protein
MDTQSVEPVGYWFCPLFGFDASRNSIELSKNIKIEKLEYLPSSIKSYLDKRKARSEDDFFDLLVPETRVAHWFMWLPQSEKSRPTLSTVSEAFQSEMEDTLIDGVTALRLCNSGTITQGEIVFFSLSPYGPGIAERRSRSYIYDRDTIWFSASRYMLEDSDIQKVNGLIESIGKWKTKTAINIAVRRFNLSYSGDFEGKIIDQMIAFESLYLGKEQELRYKLALRTAFLLGGTNKEKRKAIFDTMQQAYKIRNNIVHGTGLKDSEQDELLNMAPQTEDYLRQSICKFLSLLSQRHSLSELREKLLDENVLKNGALLA